MHGVIATYQQAGNAAQDGYESEAQFFLSATLAPKESYGHRP